MRKLIIFSLLLNTCLLGYAQIEFTNYTTINTGTNSLIDSYVHSVCVDNLGNYWYGTREGVSIFNGEKWETILEINGVSLIDTRCIFMDSENNIWLSVGSKSLLKFDGNNWIIYDQGPSTFDAYIIDEIIEDKYHNIWLASFSSGISKFDGTNWTNYGISDGVNPYSICSMASDTLGNVWVGHSYLGVFMFDGTEWVNYTNLQGLIGDIYVDNNNNIWFGTTHGVWKYDGTSWALVSNIPYISGIEQGNNGDMYFSSRYNNYGFYILSNGSLTSYGTTNSNIIGNNIDKMYKIENEILLIKKGHGISTFEDGNFTILSCDGLNDNKVYTIYQDDNNTYWFGTLGNNVCSFDNNSWISHRNTFETGSNTNSIKGSSVYSINQTNNDAHVFATNYGVSILENDNWTHINSFSGQSDDILSLFKDNQDNLWFSTDDGLVKYDNFSYEDFIFPDNYDSYNFPIPHLIYGISQDLNDIIYVGDYHYGLRIYDGNQWELVDSLKNITDIFCDADNNTWLGTTDGLFKITNSNITHLTTQNGLISDTINSILVDNNNQLWIGTPLGISFLDANGDWTSISTSDGLISNYVYYIYEDHFNNLWFCTNKGVSKIENENSVAEINSPKISIYPNPCKERLFYESNVSDFTIDVYDILGKKIFNSHSSKRGGVINLTNMQEGYYLFLISKDSKENSIPFIKL